MRQRAGPAGLGAQTPRSPQQAPRFFGRRQRPTRCAPSPWGASSVGWTSSPPPMAPRCRAGLQVGQACETRCRRWFRCRKDAGSRRQRRIAQLRRRSGMSRASRARTVYRSTSLHVRRTWQLLAAALGRPTAGDGRRPCLPVRAKLSRNDGVLSQSTPPCMNSRAKCSGTASSLRKSRSASSMMRLELRASR